MGPTLSPLNSALASLCPDGAALRCDPSFAILDVTPIGQWGASPCYLVRSTDNRLAKLRLCRNRVTRDRMLEFLSAMSCHHVASVARLLDVEGLAVLKTFVRGHTVTRPSSTSTHHIRRVAEALVRVHAVPVDLDRWQSRRLPVFDGPHQSYVVCCADGHNVVVDDDGRLGFVDLEGVVVGPRWIDVVWAQELLCETAEQRSTMWSHYLAASGATPPDREERNRMFTLYLTWLLRMLRASAAVSPNDAAIVARLEDCRDRRLAARAALTGPA